ncbi:MAG: sulfotransferase [Pseudobdellovibrionaceae bacterium]
MSKKPVSFFYLGPPKTASIWLFECLKNHPEISATDHSETNFFDMHFHKGVRWYDDLFLKKDGLRIDCTPTYINSLQALERILDYNPDAKFAYGLRNPVDRAFSGYWHVRRTGQINYTFSEILDTYVWFRAWVEPGLISPQIRWLEKMIGKDRLLPILFEDVKNRPEDLLKEVYRFMGVDENYVTAQARKPVNVARPKTHLLSRLSHHIVGEAGARHLRHLSGKREYVEGIPADFREKLNALCAPEIEELSKITGRDLNFWLDKK